MYVDEHGRILSSPRGGVNGAWVAQGRASHGRAPEDRRPENAGPASPPGPDVDLALSMLGMCAELVLALLESCARYVKWLERTPFKLIVPTANLS